MFLGQGRSDPNAADTPKEQPSPRCKRDKKRQREHSPAVQRRDNRTMHRTSGQTGSQCPLQPRFASMVQSLQHDGPMVGASFPHVAAATTSESSTFDHTFYSLGPQPLDVARMTSLTLPLPPPLLTSIVPTLEAQVTATQLMWLEQLWTVHSQRSAFPGIAAAPFLGSQHAFAATVSPNQGLIAAIGDFLDHELDAQVAQFGNHSNKEPEELLHCHGRAHPLYSSAHIHNHDVATSGTQRRRAKSDHRNSETDSPAETCDESTVGGNSRAGVALTLCIAQDKETLNENQIYLRQRIEDLGSRSHGKVNPIKLQQVGIRCRHCSHLPVGQRNKGSTYFPKNRMGIYQAAQNISVEHLQSGLCPALPADAKDRFSSFAPL